MNRFVKQILQIWWLKYLKFIRSCIQITNTEVSVVWARTSFIYVIAFTIPFTLVAVTAKIIYSITQFDYQNIIFEFLYLVILLIGLLYSKLSLESKKIFYVVMCYIFTLNLFYQYGIAGVGVLYLLLAGAFCATFYDRGKAYFTLLINFLIILFFGANQYWALFPFPITNYSLFGWLSYGLNLLFVNFVTILLIRRVIERLEKIIINESELLGQLADESLEIATLNTKLNESKTYYKYLFASNPIPMYIFDSENLRFLQVNEAMVNQYGYTKEELLQMSILDIRPASYIESTQQHVKNSETAKNTYFFQTVHQKKDKTEFPVEIRSNPIKIYGKKGKLVLVSDITDRAQYIQRIEEHNKRLQDIAWIQSHHFRAPLARIMSLVMLLKTNDARTENDELLRYLDQSADELNEIITKVIRQAE